jgi:hypothetical protein
MAMMANVPRAMVKLSTKLRPSSVAGARIPRAARSVSQTDAASAAIVDTAVTPVTSPASNTRSFSAQASELAP